jgi:hypothetical protein
LPPKEGEEQRERDENQAAARKRFIIFTTRLLCGPSPPSLATIEREKTRREFERERESEKEKKGEKNVFPLQALSLFPAEWALSPSVSLSLS